MSVSITFEPSGLSGVVAEGTYLIDAARRMGVSLGEGCTIGKSECPACLITVKSGAALLSAPSAAELKQLDVEDLAQSNRLACQVKLQFPGEVVVMATARKPGSSGVPRDTASELRRDFGALPLRQKLATLVQLEAITMSEAFDSAIEKPLAFGAKTMDAVLNKRAQRKSKHRK
ncbi:MAG TPA: 2Fe-2S iron-sulfur cluster binding domain-containing protein [Pyrinomonadaceae bacterium]|nr:2Fe-2S iron-sulfur cluster binding domain-containing protein [Pyrinomonadaceae bacterium]